MAQNNRNLISSVLKFYTPKFNTRKLSKIRLKYRYDTSNILNIT